MQNDMQYNIIIFISHSSWPNSAFTEPKRGISNTFQINPRVITKCQGVRSILFPVTILSLCIVEASKSAASWSISHCVFSPISYTRERSKDE